jgi:hypothetical protein
MSVPRTDSSYDSKPGFALDLVYNLVFKLAVKISEVKSAVLFRRSFLILRRGLTLLDSTFATLAIGGRATHPPDVGAVSLPRRDVDGRPPIWPGRQK